MISLSRFRPVYPSQRLARLTLSETQQYQEIAARSVGIARMQATTSYPKYSMTSRLNFSGFSMNIKCWPPSDSSNTSNCEPLI
jgi:hypothetical protein